MACAAALVPSAADAADDLGGADRCDLQARTRHERSPEDIVKEKRGYTGQYLNLVLGRRVAEGCGGGGGGGVASSSAETLNRRV